MLWPQMLRNGMRSRSTGEDTKVSPLALLQAPWSDFQDLDQAIIGVLITFAGYRGKFLDYRTINLWHYCVPLTLDGEKRLVMATWHMLRSLKSREALFFTATLLFCSCFVLLAVAVLKSRGSDLKISTDHNQ